MRGHCKFGILSKQRNIPIKDSMMRKEKKVRQLLVLRI